MLSTLEGIKDVVLKVLLPRIGLAMDKMGAGVATTTALIDDLEKGAYPLQHLNEDFRSYFERRNREDVFRVCVYAETEPLHVKGVPTRIVVDAGSANPNLKLSGGAAVEVVPVPGKDHATLVKPTSRKDAVSNALQVLIEQVRVECGDFCADDPLRNDVARMMFKEFIRRPQLLNLGRLSDRVHGHTNAERARSLCEGLVALHGEDLLDGLSDLRSAMSELAESAGHVRADVEALTRASGALTLLAVVHGAAPSIETATQTSSTCAVFSVPVFDASFPQEAQQFQDLMIEIRHAAIRRWPSQWTLSADGERCRPARGCSNPKRSATRVRGTRATTSII